MIGYVTLVVRHGDVTHGDVIGYVTHGVISWPCILSRLLIFDQKNCDFYNTMCTSRVYQIK